MYEHEITLIGASSFEKDDSDNQIEIPAVPVTIMCEKQSVWNSEFYNAARAGYKPELKVKIHGYEYSGEKKAIFEGVPFVVVRVEDDNFEEITLICERKAGNNGEEKD